MNGVVLDTGALIALERNDRKMWAVLASAARRSWNVIVPTTVVAQVWRRGRAQARLATALDDCLLAPFDPLAREVGALCGATATSDICDAHVALVAVRAGGPLFTSDARDLRRLLAACGGDISVLRRC